MLRPGFSFFIYVARILVAKPVSTFAEYALSRRTDRTQHRFTRPAIDLQSRRFLVRSERRAGLHPGLTVEFVLVETDARQVTLHGFDIGGAQLGRSRPRRRAHFISPAHARLPPRVDELLRGGGERVRHRVPDVAAAIAVEIDTVLVKFRRQELRQTGGAGPGRAHVLARHLAVAKEF